MHSDWLAPFDDLPGSFLIVIGPKIVRPNVNWSTSESIFITISIRQIGLFQFYSTFNPWSLSIQYGGSIKWSKSARKMLDLLRSLFQHLTNIASWEILQIFHHNLLIKYCMKRQDQSNKYLMNRLDWCVGLIVSNYMRDERTLVSRWPFNTSRNTIQCINVLYIPSSSAGKDWF